MPKPKSDHPREKHVAFFLTEDDAEYLNSISQGLGFRSRSVLITAIMEALIAGGFSGVAFTKLWKALDKRFARHGYPQQMDLGQLFRPPPVLPDPDMTEEEIEAFINQLKINLKRKKDNVHPARKSAKA